MRLRFQADADFNHIIVAAVLRRVAEVDFRSAAEAGLAGLTDAQDLALAAQDGRVLVTHDQSTMPRHFADLDSLNVWLRLSPRRGREATGATGQRFRNGGSEGGA